MADADRSRLEEIARDQPPFSQLLGLRIVSATPDEVIAEFEATPGLGNRNGVLHGGALMGVADNIGGTGAFLNLAPGEGTTTVESKTNFFRAVPIGDTARATSICLHKGRKTLVWQTSITRGDGKLAAIVTQTQLVLRPSED
ncbi:phenylacetic acid degradation protein [Mesorhizobium sp. L-8-10]|uniref:PaaI family thioesterase n=1 Tax=Mesorhizobium sp. L-8-10 TaxID=2744523 RepID=UPI00192769E8|nr:PaaI family thioesterase [Mesorhizobium sp. L-8-10]BCH31059.1 phenylacetic acid degradation protein [Mesorhizobium sp. L-8-10]